MAIITEGASGMGDKFTAHGTRAIVEPCEFAAHGARAIVIADIQDEKGHRHRHRHRSPISPISLSLSLSLFWWLVVLIVVGWLILVDGGRLIGLWAVVESEI